MTHPLLRRRQTQRSEYIEAARTWARDVAARLDVVAVVVFGSVARGDFNKWSDIDVLVVARGLPTDSRERLEVLTVDRPPRLEPVGWTPGELAERRRRGDPIAVECDRAGVTVLGTLP